MRERESVLDDQQQLEARIASRRKELLSLENWLADSRIRLESTMREVAEEREDIRQDRMKIRKQAMASATDLGEDL